MKQPQKDLANELVQMLKEYEKECDEYDRYRFVEPFIKFLTWVNQQSLTVSPEERRRAQERMNNIIAMIKNE